MRPDRLRLFIIVVGPIGLISYSIAEPTRVSPGGTGNSTEPVISNAGSPVSGNFGTQTVPTNTAPNSTSGSPGSPSTSGSPSGADEQPNVAGTDADGLPILRRKTGTEHEKIIQLKDGQKLPTSGVDPKFQGSLLNTSVDSIVSIAPKKDKDAAAAKVELKLQATNPNAAHNVAEPQKKSEPTYSRPKENSPKTAKPSATASPAAKTSSQQTP